MGISASANKSTLNFLISIITWEICIHVFEVSIFRIDAPSILKFSCKCISLWCAFINIILGKPIQTAEIFLLICKILEAQKASFNFLTFCEISSKRFLNFIKLWLNIIVYTLYDPLGVELVSHILDFFKSWDTNGSIW